MTARLCTDVEGKEIAAAYQRGYADMRSMDGYVMEHRLRVAEQIGRSLLPSESVHHINGDRQDNRIDNLQLRQGAHGKGIRLVCRCCGSDDIKAELLP
jgi:hypothetical protein